MRQRQMHRTVSTIAMLALWLAVLPGLAWAVPPSGDVSSPRKETVKKYFGGCRGKAVKDATCEKIRKDAVEILKDNVLTLGSTADRAHLPDLVGMFKSEEVELRMAAADAIGMIGPQDQDADMLVPLTNDPVPDVRHAVSNMIPHGKGKALDLLKERIVLLRTGREVEKPADPAKFSMPVAPDSVYLFDSSDATKGRLSYVVKGKSDPVRFFKAKAKKGPYKWEEFRQQYRYQLQDEEEALDQAQKAAGKQFEQEKPPDPTNVQAFIEYTQKMQSVSQGGRLGRMYFDSYQANLYGAPTVYVLEERQIGQRSYPARYVVLYQEQAFRKPGFRLSWMTVPDGAIKTAQVTSLKEQREEEAFKAASKMEEEAAKKREAELEGLVKKKDEAEKKQFKKGQADLEKELGF